MQKNVTDDELQLGPEKDQSKQPTIRDLANLLGISTATVSRALNDNPLIREETRLRVKEAAKKYNYEPNILATSLRKNKSNTIGILVPKVSIHFYSTAIEGIEEEAYRKKYKVIICQSGESIEKEIMNTKALLSSRVDGALAAISLNTNKFEHFNSFVKQKIPLVFFNRVPQDFNTSKVYSDDLKGSIMATRHMVMTGCRRLAHLGGHMQLSLSKNRLNGFLQVLNELGIERNDKFIVETGAERENGYIAMKKLLESKDYPDGVLAFNDRVAIGAMQAIHEAGLKIPDDISIIGFSNSPSSTIVQPNLSTVEQSGFEVGKKAFDMLMNQIDKEDIKPQIDVVDTKLILRGTTR